MTRAKDIQETGQKGKRIRAGYLELRIKASPYLHPRVGFVVPKFGRTAVERNMLKRRLREIVRRRILHDLPAVDILVRASARAYAVSFSGLVEELDRLIDRALQEFMK